MDDDAGSTCIISTSAILKIESSRWDMKSGFLELIRSLISSKYSAHSSWKTINLLSTVFITCKSFELNLCAILNIEYQIRILNYVLSNANVIAKTKFMAYIWLCITWNASRVFNIGWCDIFNQNIPSTPPRIRN